MVKRHKKLVLIKSLKSKKKKLTLTLFYYDSLDCWAIRKSVLA